MAQPLPAALPTAGRGRAADAEGGSRSRTPACHAVRRRWSSRGTTARPTDRSSRWSPRRPARELDAIVVQGDGAPLAEFELPYRGQRLRGRTLHDQLDAWERAGILEPSAAEARPRGRRPSGVAAAGGSHRRRAGRGRRDGPAAAAAPWGATVAAVDLPTPAIWERVVGIASSAAGRLLVPVTAGSGGDDLARDAGADLLAEVPAVADWLGGPRRAPGPGQLPLRRRRHPRPRLRGGRRARHSRHGRAARHRARLPGHPDRCLRRCRTTRWRTPTAPTTSARAPPRWSAARCAGCLAGRLLHRAYPPGADLGIGDCLVPAQGPNYALAKRIQRWRATSTAPRRPRRSPSTWRPRPGPARWSRTAPWPPPSPAPTGSGSRSSTPTPPTP